MRLIAVIGSVRFEKVWREQCRRICINGDIPLATHVFQEPLREDQERVLLEADRKRIDLSDEVFVIDVNGYIGTHTKMMLDYAKKLNKPVLKFSDPWWR